jgi:hypothetical protein
MLIRRLTLVAFALFATATSSLALIATPALADQRDHGRYQQHQDRGGRGHGYSQDHGYNNRGGYNNHGGYNTHGRDHGHNG